MSGLEASPGNAPKAPSPAIVGKELANCSISCVHVMIGYKNKKKSKKKCGDRNSNFT
jgi:hypothetical protein